MKLALVFTMFRPDEAGRQKVYKDWLYSDEVQKQLAQLGVTELIIRYASPNHIIDGEGYVIKYKDLCPKGSAVRLQLDALCEKNPDLIIFSDGDGQIPQKSILRALKILSETVYKALISCRPRTQGIAGDREKVEKFELFILEEIYGIHLPDGQCGFWGFTGDVLPKLNLRAIGFELELDILSEILRKSVNFCFVEVDVKRGEISSFREEDHERKIRFLADKYNIDDWDISKYISKFESIEKKTGKEHNLPETYKKSLRELKLVGRRKKKTQCFSTSCKSCGKIETKPY